MKLSHLRDVLIVAESGSLRSAARQLRATQPALTRSIRELEHELGVALFERHAKGVRLTDMGRVFIRRAQAVQSEIKRAQEEIEQLKGGTTGEVSVALSTATIMSLMPRAVAEFRRRFPEAVLKIHESFFQPIERELVSGRIDFYVGPLDRASSAPQFVVEQLFTNHRVVVARRGHPLRDAQTLAELVDAHWLRPTLSSHIVEGDFEEMFARAGLPRPAIVLQARSALITILALRDSDLLTVVPRQWLDVSMIADLIEPLTLPAIAAAPIAIVRRQDLPLTPIAEHLCDLMRRVGTHYGNTHVAEAMTSLSA
ncbi:LysR substrate-binding domain-containing protein [Sphingomonas sp.]|uniref:LysR substrate-binding domain-containing protein n=1 Tax=Sphingomonas sp. TaxID=28214 RepID=UPI0025FA63EF|nr:LysR substrate-binding domain-containing protein [Sphingomonas sp.]